MVALRVVADRAVVGAGTRDGAYARDVTAALVQTCPANCTVEAVAGAGRDGMTHVGGALIARTSLVSSQLTLAWKLGFPVGSGGLVHSPSLLAPLNRHSRTNGDQVTVTVRDLDAWLHPGALRPVDVSWTKAMLRRAHRRADAVIVATHSLAGRLNEIIDFGDRLRVLAPAAPVDLIRPDDPVAQARALGLPDRYVVIACQPRNLATARRITVALKRSGLAAVVLQTGAALSTAPDDDANGSNLTVVVDADGRRRAIVISAAEAYILAEDGGDNAETLLEPLTVGTPIVHLADSAYAEMAQDAAVVVQADSDDCAEALSRAALDLIADATQLRRLRTAGTDRDRLFNWRATGEHLWRIHAEL